jgi:hypothetical protein
MMVPNGSGSLVQNLNHERLNNQPQRSTVPSHAEYRQRQAETSRNEHFQQNVNHHFGNAVAQAISDEQTRQYERAQLGEFNQGMQPLPPAQTSTPVQATAPQQDHTTNWTVKKSRGKSDPEDAFDVRRLHGAGRRPIGTVQVQELNPIRLTSGRGATVGPARMYEEPQMQAPAGPKTENLDDSGFVEGNSFKMDASGSFNLFGNGMTQHSEIQYHNGEEPSMQGQMQGSQFWDGFGADLLQNDDLGDFDFSQLLPDEGLQIGADVPPPQDGPDSYLDEEGFHANGQELDFGPSEQPQSQMSQPDTVTYPQQSEQKLENVVQDSTWSQKSYPQPNHGQESELQQADGESHDPTVNDDATQQTELGDSDADAMGAQIRALVDQDIQQNSAPAIAHEQTEQQPSQSPPLEWQKLSDHIHACSIRGNNECARCVEYENHEYTKFVRGLQEPEEEEEL